MQFLLPLTALVTAAWALDFSLPALAVQGLVALLEGLVLAIAWVAAVGWGKLGERLLRPHDPDAEVPGSARIAARAGGGLAWVMAACHLLGLAGALGPVSLAVLVLVGAGAALHGLDPRSALGRLRAALAMPHPLFAALGTPAALLLVAASMPPGILWQDEAAGYDALGYHLQVAREWYDAGGIVPLPHNTYSYLPLHLEVLYYALMVARGGPLEAMIACQWLHASLALATSVLLGVWTAERTGSRGAGWVAGGLWLALPGTVMIGSLAYNEMAMLFLGASAAVLALGSPRGALFAGLLSGAAVAVKLTAAGYVALPVGSAVLAARGGRPRRGGLFAAGLILVLAPHLVRNALWTGNPLFPMAARTLGRAHWSEESAQRWARAHTPPGTLAARCGSIVDHGILDPRFHPAWWLAAAAGLALAGWRRRSRRAAGVVAGVALAHVALWAAFTHTAGRFLLPIAVPLCAGAGLGWAGLEADGDSPRARRVRGGALLLLLAVLAISSARRFRDESTLIPGVAPADLVAAPELVHDARVPPELRHETFLLLGEGRAFYFPAGTLYAAPFEEGPFARAWREAHGDPGAVLDALRARGVTLVHVNWMEVERLRATYGLDAAITREHLLALERAGLRRVDEASAGQVWVGRVPPR